MKEFAPFRLDTVNQCLRRRRESGEDERVPLTPKAFAVLRYLVNHAGRLVTQDELLEAVWPDTFVQPEVLKYQIADIRGVLGDPAKNPLFIETLPRRGYRFIAPICDAEPPQPLPVPGKNRLVGRQRELAALHDSLRRTLQGQRQIVFITGEPGIGRTALVDEFVRQASAEEPSFRIIRGQCVEGYGGSEAYYPMLEALGQLCRGRDADKVIEILAAHAPTWLVQLPAFLKPEHRETLQREILGATRDRMLREVREALDVLTAETVLLLLLEDLQWVDPSTIDLLSALARERTPAKIMVIVTKRPVDPDTPGHPLKRLKEDLLLHHLCQEIALHRLSVDDVGEYLLSGAQGTSLREDFAELIHQYSGGNPLFMIAALDRMREVGQISRENGRWELNVPIEDIELAVPETLRQMIEAQIDRLTIPEQRALEAASVTSSSFSANVVAGALNQDADVVLDLFEKLVHQSCMIRAGGSQPLSDGGVSQIFSFVHAFHREVFYWRQTPARRASLHRRMGEQLANLGSDRQREVAAEIAYHFERASDWARAIEHLRMAARSTAQRFACAEAATILRHAIELSSLLPETNRALTETLLLRDLARIYQVSFDPRDIETYESVVARAARHDWPEIEGHALLNMAMSLARVSYPRWQEALERVGTAVARVQVARAQAILRARLLIYVTVGGEWNRDAAREFRKTFAKVVESEDELAIVNATIFPSFIQLNSSEYRQAYTSMKEALSIVAENEVDIFSSVVAYWLSLVVLPRALLFSGEWGEALREIDAEIAAMKGKSWNQERAVLWKVHRAWLLYHALDFEGVQQICDEVLRSSRDTSLDTRERLCRVLAGSAETALGNYDRAMEHFSKVRREMDHQKLMDDWYTRLLLESGLTDLSLANSEFALARGYAEEFLAHTLATDEHTWQALAWEANARVATAERDLERARESVTQALHAMEGFDVPLAAWRVHATAADVFDSMGNMELADEHRERSRAVIYRLANSLAPESPLRKTFLEAPAIRHILRDAVSAI